MKFLSFILSLFVSLLSFGQNNSLLYKIESPNSKTSYLFGTMHVIPDSAYYIPVKVQKILKHSDKLVMEIANLDMIKAQRLLMLPEGSSCFDIFTPSQKDSVIQWGSKSLGVNEETFVAAFGSLKPFALMQLGTKDLMSDNVKYIEIELQKMAADLPKEGFETVEEQIGFFDNLPKNTMAEMIMQMVRDENTGDEMMSSLIKAYMAKDLDKLTELAKDEEDQIGTNAILLDQRNERWIPKIQEFTKTQSCFIAVGAAHLGGENGVIALLKKQGYTVTPIPY